MVIEELTKELLKYKNKLNHVNGNFKLMKEINENLYKKEALFKNMQGKKIR